MVYQTRNPLFQAVMNNLKLTILEYLAAKKSRIIDRRRDICDWSSNSSIWNVIPVPSRNYTQYNTLKDNALHTNSQHLSLD